MNLVIVQARMSSSRLPGKVMMPLCRKPMILRQIERIKQCSLVDKIVIATTIEKEDDIIVNLCKENSILYFRGSLENVLQRYYYAAKKYNPSNIIRLTGDCPLIDPKVIDQVIKQHIDNQNDYTSNTMQPTYPDGMDVEIMTFGVLEKVYRNANRSSQKEHVTLYINENSHLFKTENIGYYEDLSNYRLTVDEPEDYLVVSKIYENLYPVNPYFTLIDIIKLLGENKNLLFTNGKYLRNEGLLKSLKEENIQ